MRRTTRENLVSQPQQFSKSCQSEFQLYSYQLLLLLSSPISLCFLVRHSAWTWKRLFWPLAWELWLSMLFPMAIRIACMYPVLNLLLLVSMILTWAQQGYPRGMARKHHTIAPITTPRTSSAKSRSANQNHRRRLRQTRGPICTIPIRSLDGCPRR